MRIAAVDPGRDKCGLAIVAENGKVLDQAVVATVWLVEEMVTRIKEFGPELLLIGNGTTSKRVYWEAHPPTGWRRFFPTSMQVPPVPVDDFVAVILAQRYLINKNYR